MPTLFLWPDWNGNLTKLLTAILDVELLMSTLAISVLQGFFLGIVLGVSKHTREHSNVVPQIIALLMELSMKTLTTVPS